MSEIEEARASVSGQLIDSGVIAPWRAEGIASAVERLIRAVMAEGQSGEAKRTDAWLEQMQTERDAARARAEAAEAQLARVREAASWLINSLEEDEKQAPEKGMTVVYRFRLANLRAALAASPDNAKEGGEANHSDLRSNVPGSQDNAPPVSEPAAQGRAFSDTAPMLRKSVGLLGEAAKEMPGYGVFFPILRAALDHMELLAGWYEARAEAEYRTMSPEPATPIPPPDLIEGLTEARAHLLAAAGHFDEIGFVVSRDGTRKCVEQIDALLTKYGARQ